MPLMALLILLMQLFPKGKGIQLKIFYRLYMNNQLSNILTYP